MTPKPKHRRLLVLLICAAAVLSGCRKTDSASASSTVTDPKAQIYQYLAQKSGQKEFSPGIDLDLPKHVATLRSNATVLEQRKVALKTALRAADEDPPLQKEIEQLRAVLAKAEQETVEARRRLNEAEKRSPANATEIAERAKDYTTREAMWMAKRQEFAAKEAQLEAERAMRKEKRVALEREFSEMERAWEVARSAAARKQEELSNQEDNYIRFVRQEMSGVRSYEAVYRIVGQQLATADRLLAESDPARRRMGLKMAREACGHVNSGELDVWLAARICENYFWPNLDLADTEPGSRERALDLLETCRRVFFDTYETNNVLKNYSLLMSNAPNARAADTFRVQLADWLEEKGNVKYAAEILNEIRDAEVLASAQERITRVRESVATNP